MSKYEVTLRGEKFPVHENGRWHLVGFYATRWVEASSPHNAQAAAVRLIQKDPTWNHVKPRPGFPTPRIYPEFVMEIDEFDDEGDAYDFFEMHK